MDMKRLLQVIDGSSTKPVEGVDDIKKSLSVITEGVNPHKVSLPVQMAMQHYQQPVVKKESILKKYFKEAEQVEQEQLAEKKEILKMYSQQIASRVMERRK